MRICMNIYRFLGIFSYISDSLISTVVATYILWYKLLNIGINVAKIYKLINSLTINLRTLMSMDVLSIKKKVQKSSAY